MSAGKERETARPGESGKVWTVTQGHGAHGGGGGTETLLMAACGISYRRHGADSTYPPPAVTPSGKRRIETGGGGFSPVGCQWDAENV